MTEAEWLTSDRPADMLAVIRRWRAKPVRLRRLAAELDPATLLAETLPAVGQAVAAAAAGARPTGDPVQRAAAAAWAGVWAAARDHDGWGGSWNHVRNEARSEAEAAARSVVQKQLADRLRCLLGNPFRPVAFDTAWRTTTVAAIATGAYADRAWDRLPVLADALEDAGCDAADLLAHLRGPGPHARGCWALDAVLGKT